MLITFDDIADKKKVINVFKNNINLVIKKWNLGMRNYSVAGIKVKCRTASY